MLRKLSELMEFTIAASDDAIGKAHDFYFDFYFDDELWTLRYAVVDTGPWFFGQQVLIAPAAVERPDWDARRLPVSLTKAQVENSPPITVDPPVSRQLESALHDCYGWPGYWHLGLMVGAPLVAPHLMSGLPMPMDEKGEPVRGAADAAMRRQGDPHLRSAREVTGYHIQAIDGEIGHEVQSYGQTSRLQLSVRYGFVELSCFAAWLFDKDLYLNTHTPAQMAAPHPILIGRLLL